MRGDGEEGGEEWVVAVDCEGEGGVMKCAARQVCLAVHSFDPNCSSIQIVGRLSSSYPRQIHLKSIRYFTWSVT
jgi:hypothetical protein